MVHVSTWDTVVLAFATTAAIADLCWRKIPRVLTVTGLVTGLAFHLWHGGLRAFLIAVLAAVLGFIVGIALFRLGAIGGGDVKLIVAMGAMLSLEAWIVAMEAAILAAGAIALIQAVRHGRLRQTLRNTGEILHGLGSRGLQPHPVINVSNPAMLRAPFGVAVAIGTVLAVVRL